MTMRDEYGDKYADLDRLAVVINYKQALYDWVNSVTPDDPVKPNKEDDGSVYLLPAADYIDEWDDLLKDYYLEIFKCELYSWYRDDKTWPKTLSWEKFTEFFDYGFKSMIVDLAEDTPELNDPFGAPEQEAAVQDVKLHQPVLKEMIKMACGHIYTGSRDLLNGYVSERAIAHHLAIALEVQLAHRGYSVDVEYNQMTDAQGRAIKKVLNIQEGNKEKPVYPDIIVHKRGNNDFNLLAVEIKIEGHGRPADREYDMKKLEAYCKELGYGYGVFLEFGVSGVVDEVWVKKGKRV